MSRLVIFAALIAVVGCATQRTQLEIVGPYANHLSRADIQQITALIFVTEMYDHGKTTLEAVRPDKVRVNYVGYGRSLGHGTVSDTGSTYFIALKRNGRWIPEGDLVTKPRSTAH